jgi:hypothetical protein
MPGSRIIVVHLRRPKSKGADPEEMRSDPFWEFGSFGITGCHSNNLMHPRNVERLQGVRLAFAQGGNEGMRLVHLTPPIRVIQHRDRLEATWSPSKMPFCYHHAPTLARKLGEGDFPKLEEELRSVRRSTEQAKFSSRFRSSGTPLGPSVAEEVISIYSAFRSKSKKSEIASSYTDALPSPPPLIDRDREKTYSRLLKEARSKHSVRSQVKCGPGGLSKVSRPVC